METTVNSRRPAGALSGFGTIGRNSVYGPHFFDVDLSLMKDVKITEHATFSFGTHFYNLINHPNFDQPVNDIANPLFGRSIQTVSPPTSILGSFLGAGSSPALYRNQRRGSVLVRGAGRIQRPLSHQYHTTSPRYVTANAEKSDVSKTWPTANARPLGQSVCEK